MYVYAVNKIGANFRPALLYWTVETYVIHLPMFSLDVSIYCTYSVSCSLDLYLFQTDLNVKDCFSTSLLSASNDEDLQLTPRAESLRSHLRRHFQ